MNRRLWSAADREQIRHHGLELQEVERQLSLFREPPPPTALARPCVTGDGIRCLEQNEHDELLERAAAAAGRLSKFVPASGAASRMFSQLSALRQGGDNITQEARTSGQQFLTNLDRFPFRDRLAETMLEKGQDLEAACTHGDTAALLAALLDEGGLRYASLPKALILFHHDGKNARTAAEEHLREGAELVQDHDHLVRIHFTVPAVQRQGCDDALGDLRRVLEHKLGVRFQLTTSIQKPSTDTLAADTSGQPFRDAAGHLVFRPGGHGSLLKNLANTDGDLVIVKNIDNILPEAGRVEVVRWKQLLLGHLLRLEERAVEILKACEQGTGPWLEDALRFVATELSVPSALERLESTPEKQRTYLLDRLDRPLRVCGMVLATGEPGGGPFWVQDRNGDVSPQIVETSQIDLENPKQRELLQKATHFNPVDLVVRLRSHRGAAYDLDRFVDPRTVFISRKSHDGQPLLALEHPGLWNGSMAHWNTVFVEVPGVTFAPVKTVFDLLRDEHQSRSADAPFPRSTK
jgi:hypothetical protein